MQDLDVLGVRNVDAIGVRAVFGGRDVEVRQDDGVGADDGDVVPLAVQVGQSVDVEVVGPGERQCLPPICKMSITIFTAYMQYYL